MAVKIEKRNFADLSTAEGISPLTRKMLESNPFADREKDAVQLVGMNGGVVAGGEAVFPLRIMARGTEYKVIGGAELWVSENQRQSMLGVMLPDAICRESPSKAIVGAAASQQALPVYGILGYKIFLMPRYIALWRSRAVVEMKLHGLIAKLASWLVDLGICCYSALLRIVDGIHLRGLSVSAVGHDDFKTIDAVASLIAADKKPYCEVHDAAWFKWHFDVYPETMLYVVRRGSEIIGAFMTLKKFHEQASHRGFKNVWLGSVLEWQVADGNERLLPWIILKASLALRDQGADAVDIPTVDVRLQSFFKKLLWRQVGDSNFVYKVLKDSPLFADGEMKKPENWRLRPAMSDVALG